MCEARLAEGFFFALRKSHWGIGIKSLKPITISIFSPKDGYFPKILHNYSRKAARFFGKDEERVKEGGEGNEGEAFTLIMQVIKELRAKGEEVKEKNENSLMRAHAREGYFRPKSAGISPHWSVSHFKMGLVTRCALSQASARAIIS